MVKTENDDLTVTIDKGSLAPNRSLWMRVRSKSKQVFVKTTDCESTHGGPL